MLASAPQMFQRVLLLATTLLQCIRQDRHAVKDALFGNRGQGAILRLQFSNLTTKGFARAGEEERGTNASNPAFLNYGEKIDAFVVASIMAPLGKTLSTTMTVSRRESRTAH
jgi:hypothetical protein